MSFDFVKLPIFKKIKADEILREHYAFGMFLAAVEAIYSNKERVTVLEFGIYRGDGLRSLVEIARLIEAELPITFDIFGFDSFVGLKPLNDHRDHPEIWQEGILAVPDWKELIKEYEGKAKVLIGDMNETVPKFIDEHMSVQSPVGFVVLDCDLYSSTIPCLKVFENDPAFCLPVVPMYVDDCNYLLTYSDYSGETRAILEFNNRNELRKIAQRLVRQTAPRKLWHFNFHFAHILDHPIRQGAEKPKYPFELTLDSF